MGENPHVSSFNDKSVYINMGLQVKSPCMASIVCLIKVQGPLIFTTGKNNENLKARSLECRHVSTLVKTNLYVPRRPCEFNLRCAPDISASGIQNPTMFKLLSVFEVSQQKDDTGHRQGDTESSSR